MAVSRAPHIPQWLNSTSFPITLLPVHLSKCHQSPRCLSKKPGAHPGLFLPLALMSNHPQVPLTRLSQSICFVSTAAPNPSHHPHPAYPLALKNVTQPVVTLKPMLPIIPEPDSPFGVLTATSAYIGPAPHPSQRPFSSPQKLDWLPLPSPLPGIFFLQSVPRILVTQLSAGMLPKRLSQTTLLKRVSAHCHFRPPSPAVPPSRPWRSS